MSMSSKQLEPLDQKHRPPFLLSFFRGRLLRFLGFKAATLRIGSLVLILGFLAVVAGLYSALQNGGDDDVFPTVTIFSAPRPFSYSGGRLDLGGGRQELAVRSWLALAHEVNVVLFGKDSSIFELASSLGPRVTVETAIDFSFVGTPFFHCMIARSQNYSSAISVVIDPETILLPNFLAALHCAYKLDRDWFLFSMTPSISNFPFHIDDTGKYWFKEDGTHIGIQKLQEYVIKELQWRNCGDKLLMAWNTGEVPLHAGILPPFLYGKGFHNLWLLHEVLSSEFRLAIDSSYIASAIYLENPAYHFKRNIAPDAGNGGWEVAGNRHLAALYGSFSSGQQNSLTTALKYIKCSGKHFLVDSLKKVVFSNEEANTYPFDRESRLVIFFRMLLHLPFGLNLGRCIVDINLLEHQCSLKKIYKKASTKPLALSYQFDLESLLHITADKHKTIVLAIAGENYRDMLMSWVCRLRYLSVSNFIVCALDTETYQFALLMGLPVFKDRHPPSNISFNDCHFGTNCFQRVTKVKSRIVLQILKLGYSVLLSDVDIYWFNNPLTYLQSFDPAILVAQTDEYNETGPINFPRRLNSGFYFARSDPPTIAAMEKVVRHASASALSEQPSFYDVLCGEGGTNRIDSAHCFEPGTNLTVHFLDRNLFPNGAYRGLWGRNSVRSVCRRQGCLILHNNWISGRLRKLERQVRSGLWEYDPAFRMCFQSWHRTNLTSHFF